MPALRFAPQKCGLLCDFLVASIYWAWAHLFPFGCQSCHLYNGHLIIHSITFPALNVDAFLHHCRVPGVGLEGPYLAQSITELKRWAMSSTVHWANQLSRAACIWSSVPGSTAAVASSRMRIWVFRRRARARHSSCFWPRLGESGTVRPDVLCVCTSGFAEHAPNASPQ